MDFRRVSRRGCLTAFAVVLFALPSPTRAGEEELVLRAAWGSGSAELGRRGGDESAPEGPMSFAVAPDGRVVVLDQANARLAVFGADGRFAEARPLPADTYQDLGLVGDTVVLLDRLARRTVDWLSPKGDVVHRVAVEGGDVREGGGVTALLVRSDGVWLEYDHRRSVLVADRDGTPRATRTSVTGRPYDAPDLRAHARLAGPRAVEVWTVGRKDEVIRAHAELVFARPVARIVALDLDAEGRVFLVAHLRDESPEAPFAITGEALQVRVLAPTLEELQRVELPPSVGPWEQLREVVVTESGALYRMAFTSEGVEVRRWLP